MKMIWSIFWESSLRSVVLSSLMLFGFYIFGKYSIEDEYLFSETDIWALFFERIFLDASILWSVGTFYFMGETILYQIYREIIELDGELNCEGRQNVTRKEMSQIDSEKESEPNEFRIPDIRVNAENEMDQMNQMDQLNEMNEKEKMEDNRKESEEKEDEKAKEKECEREKEMEREMEKEREKESSKRDKRKEQQDSEKLKFQDVMGKRVHREIAPSLSGST